MVLMGSLKNQMSNGNIDIEKILNITECLNEVYRGNVSGEERMNLCCISRKKLQNLLNN